MEIRVLNYFLMVAREENITKAANLLHVTQPTLSRQLMQLEEELGVKLFKRGSHSISLTEDGLLLKRRAGEVMSLVAKTKQEMRKHEEFLSGEIAIGCGEMSGMNSLSKMMIGFRKLHPDVHFDIFSGNADGIKEQIENGILDLGMLLEPVDIGKYEFIRIPEQDVWGVMVNDDSPLANNKVVTPKELVGIPIIAPKRALVRNELSNWLGDYADEIDVVSTYNLMYNAVMQVNNGMGALLCLKLEANYDGVRFIPLSPVLQLNTVLAWKKSQIFSPTVQAFVKYIKQCLEDITGYEL